MAETLNYRKNGDGLMEANVDQLATFSLLASTGFFLSAVFTLFALTYQEHSQAY